MPTLGQLGEFALIERLISELGDHSELTRLGMGDDCATIRVADGYQLISTDSLVAGVHFDLNLFPPSSIGYRSLAVNISDIAAMGGTAKYALISLHAPASTDVAILEQIYSGLSRCAKRFGVKIVGGNTTSASEIIIGVTIVGEVSGEPIRRSGARVGDGVWVSGRLGGAAVGLKLLRESKSEDVINRLLYPEPRIELGQYLQKNNLATAMIDISDGVFQDLGHLTASSGVSAEVRPELIPVHPGVDQLVADTSAFISAGDDYELLFTVPKERERELSDISLELTRIGEIVQKDRGNLSDLKARFSPGFRHFS